MEHQVQNHKILYTMILMFGLITTLGFSSVQSAFADPDPAQSYIKATIVQGAQANISIDQAIGESLTTSNAIRVYQIAKNTASLEGSAGLGNCPDGSEAGLAGVDVWQLVRASDDAPIGYKFLADSDAILGKVTVKYGTGVGTTSVNTVQVIPNGETDLRVNGADNGAVGTAITAYWKIAQGVNVINTDNLGFQSFLTCGTEGGAGNYLGGGQIQIVKPVGGEIIPVSTTALLLAGASTSAFWLLPLAVVAAGAFTVLRFQVSRK